ncbi:hypothetical protein [Enterococcus faecalis]|uniref:hypothetical protein n=1 Tax=Enterococcus faecalis TaxID=1351 RepID=UPI00201B31DF|nr:hypothetical protein [Enterococcus faecalis]MCL4595504.1 hypothetical protein [Enterococcus faecalis]
MNRKQLIMRMSLMDQREILGFDLDIEETALYDELKKVIKKHGLSYEQVNRVITVIDDRYFENAVTKNRTFSQ